VDYGESDPEVYVLPLGALPAERETDRDHRVPVIARLLTSDGEFLLFDAFWDPAFDSALLDLMGRRRRVRGGAGELIGSPFPPMARTRRAGELLNPAPMLVEQSNTSVVFGDRLILKLFRRAEEGVNPDVEIGRFLTESVGFPQVPAVTGAIDYRRGRRHLPVGVLQSFVPNEGDAWRYTLDELTDYLERVLSMDSASRDAAPVPPGPRLLRMAATRPPPEVEEAVGGYLESARLLGQRTAELHLALASRPDDPDFAPEPFTALHQRSLYQSMRTLTARIFRLLRDRREELTGVAEILDLEPDIQAHFRSLLETKISAARIRCHRDLHLGQVLFTGKDFVFIDFEGEPARPLGERRLKRSPLVDVTGMIRSFHYAAYTALFGEYGIVRHEDHVELEPWAQAWYLWVSATFLRTYLETAGQAPFIPPTEEQLRVLSNALLLEKALYELGYEANNRPDWIKIPIRGILQFLEAAD
jgi:maltose alpha-D-glucosyltransferase/alpha-amylase